MRDEIVGHELDITLAEWKIIDTGAWALPRGGQNIQICPLDPNGIRTSEFGLIIFQDGSDELREHRDEFFREAFFQL